MADRSLGLPCAPPAWRKVDDQELTIGPVVDRMGRVWRTVFATGARFWRAEEGNILIMGALLLPILLGMAALVLEYGGGLVARAANQRNADIAAYAGAVQYSTSRSQDAMRAAALQAARLNGLDPAQVTADIVPSPRGNGEAVRVRVTEQHSIVLGTILGANPMLDIVVEAYANIGEQGAAACILALDSSLKGVSLTGGTQVNAAKCAVSSNATLSVPCGTLLTAQAIHYDTAPPTQGCGGIQDGKGGPGQIEKVRTPDPLAGDLHVAAAAGRIATVAALPALAAPVAAAASNFDFGWSTPNLASQAASIGCTVSGTAPAFLVTCNKATVNIGTLSVNGDVTVDFDISSPATRAFVFNGAINVAGGGKIRFGRGSFTVAGGVSVQNGSATFGAGTFNIGTLAAACRYGDTDRYGVCVNGGGTLTFGGPSAFTVRAGIYTGDGSRLQMGDGTSNRFDIGASAQRNSIYVGGGASAILADALGDADSFRMRGNINGGGGGSCLIVSAAPNHDIAGKLVVGGAVILGAGVYTLDGVFHLTGGGGALCGGSNVSVRGIGVSIVLSGKDTPTGGACPNQVFCIGSGYNDVELSPPTSGPTAQLAVIGPQNGSTKGASLVAGAVNTRISGAFYFPTGPLTMGGGAGINNTNASACLQLIASQVDMSAGATIATDCTGRGVGAKKRRVVFVQ